MRIYDSNLLIYSFQPAYSFLQADFLQANAYLSNITKLEVLGYQLISQAEKNYFERLFTLTNFLQIDDVIINEAINLRQMRKMSTGDSIVAATAKIYNLDVYTHNTNDFKWISGLNIIDPLLNSSV